MEKEAYFSQGSLKEKTRELLSYIEASRLRHSNMVFNPAKAALLVLDMQDYFLQPDSHAFIPSAQAIVPGINTLIDAFVSAKQPVIATRHVNTPEDAGMMMAWWRDLIDPRSEKSQCSRVVRTERSIQISKTQYDAFLGTILDKTLQTYRVSQVVITGVMTHLCCETTARSAFGRGYEVFFAIDGTATYTEEFHRASLLNLSHGFAVPVLVEEILAAYG